MKTLGITLPEYFTEMIAYPGQARYVALYYMGSKATWADGWASATFSFYSAYQVLIYHPALMLALAGVNLGNDDEMPTHALVWDREAGELFVAAFDAARAFARHQHGGRFPTDEEVEPYKTLLLVDRPTVDNLRRLGLHEIMLGHSERQRELAEQLTLHLNQYLPQDVRGQVM